MLQTIGGAMPISMESEAEEPLLSVTTRLIVCHPAVRLLALEGLVASYYALQVGPPQVLERPFSASLGPEEDGIPAREGPHVFRGENLCPQHIVPAALIKGGA